MKTEFLQTHWPLGFRYGMAVTCRWRNAHVAAARPEVVPHGCLPVIFDKETSVMKFVPVDEVERRVMRPNDNAKK